MRSVAKLDRGSFALKADTHGKDAEIISIVVDRFQTTFIQRPDNFETSLSLTSFAVHDGTTADRRVSGPFSNNFDSAELGKPNSVELHIPQVHD